MSYHLYPNRIWYYGEKNSGIKLDKKYFFIKDAPKINGKEVVLLDYIPSIGLKYIQYRDSEAKDMSEKESELIEAFLMNHKTTRSKTTLEIDL